VSADATPQDVLEGRARWCVVCADNAEVLPGLPDKSVAHVITDPPYSNFTHDKTRGAGVAVDLEPIGFDAITDADRARLAGDFARVVSRWSLIWTDAEGVTPWVLATTTNGLEHIRVGAWVKRGMAPQFSGDRPGTGYEACVISHPKGRKRWNGGGHVAVWTHWTAGRDDEARLHTTQKPLALMLELVELFTDPGEVILDPFAGSGTTGVACLRLGRRFIGIERDARYAAIARERLAAESQGLTLRAARAGQLSLLGGL
jgi:site-specific DNA-methyltransferase (adenine-specific)